VELSDTKVIRQRTVYTIVEFLAEVSGIADIFYVLTASFMVSFYTPKMLESERIKLFGKFKLYSKPSKDKVIKILEALNLTDTSEKKLMTEILSETSKRGTLNLNPWMTLIVKFLPESLRSKKINQVFKHVDQSLKR
jgi:hypothetical protein